jgi:hypothetical protein
LGVLLPLGGLGAAGPPYAAEAFSKADELNLVELTTPVGFVFGSEVASNPPTLFG